MISLFSGVSLFYCMRQRAKTRRIAARKLLHSNPSYSKLPLVTTKGKSTTNVEVDRSSMMFTSQPETEYFPARSAPSLSNYHSHTTSTTSRTTASTRDYRPQAHTNEQTTPSV